MGRVTCCLLWCSLAVIAAGPSCTRKESADPEPRAPAGKPADRESQGGESTISEPAEAEPSKSLAPEREVTEPEAASEERAPAPPTPPSVEGLTPTTTDSGLRYWDMKVGEGDQPRSDTRVTFHFTGWLSDGTVFDSSLGKETPPSYVLARLNKGMSEGIGSMRVGGRRLLEIPPELGYGDRGSRRVPPNATMLVEIELLAIMHPPQPISYEGLTPVTTESGLTYYDFKVGDGIQPLPGGEVKVHYSMWLSDGRLVGTSMRTPGPDIMPLNDVFDGWAEGIGSMRVGGKRRLEVPPELGYGEAGRHGIPPNATLIIEVELVGIVPPSYMAAIEGVEPVVKASGLTYWTVKTGDGPSPEPTSTVTFHFAGWLTDGTMFADTRECGEPLTIPLNQTIKGVQEGMISMKVGGVRWMKMPPELAYGDVGLPPNNVGPGETVIVQVELIDISDE